MMDADERQRLLQPGMRAVDLGAAPGGWTWVLTRHHVQVSAIDNGPLAAHVMDTGLVTHVRADGFRWRPAKTVDWLVCDMVEQPIRVATLIGGRPAVSRRRSRRLAGRRRLPPGAVQPQAADEEALRGNPRLPGTPARHRRPAAGSALPAALPRPRGSDGAGDSGTSLSRVRPAPDRDGTGTAGPLRRRRAPRPSRPGTGRVAATTSSRGEVHRHAIPLT
jgi:hypothetical protein